MSLSKDRLRLWLRLLKASHRIEGEVRRRLRDREGTTLPRFDVMAALDRHPGGLKMSALSDLLRVSNGNVTGIVDRLVQEGLVRRAPVPGDRRAQAASLTDAGRTEFARLAAAHEAWIDELLSGLGAAEIAEMGALLDRAREAEHAD